ncbi:hypothetical protein GCM10009844_41440 [Nocardioides koreensis]|uniref:SGNH hydrolase-type esterase domain-containing protein n=1 Tax=Nocardioides koreensis TaxID=433651 RepID=A0ABN3A6U9_9ACTN
MRIVLLGDSHLARVRRDRARLAPPGADVVNAAVGGAVASELVPQAVAAGVGPDDVLVVSIGSNDAAPWKQVHLDTMAACIDDFLARTPRRALVYVVPPGVDEAGLTGPGDRTDAVVTAYADAAAERFGAAGATLVHARDLLAPLGAAAFADDAVHLTGAGYDLLLPAIREAVAQTAGRPAT